MAARGLTNHPLVIVVAAQWLQRPEVLELMRAGHHVFAYNAGLGRHLRADLILHPAAHGWTDDMWDYLPAALTAARRRRRTK